MTVEKQKAREMHEATVFAKKRLDNPHFIVCHPRWAQYLNDYLMNRDDGSITTTGAYGLPIVTDERIPGVAVVKFTDQPCVKEI